MGESERAYERALVFLEKRDRTEQEVFRKLTEVGYSEETAGDTVSRLREAGLVNDADYAQRYLEALINKGRGRLRITQEMRRKGLPGELVRNTLEDGLFPEDERVMAAAAARKCLAALPEGEDPRKAAAKVSRKLVSLGYTWEVIGHAMREAKKEVEEEDDEVPV